MDFDHDDQQTRVIAQHWGVSVEDLDRASWELEEIEGNDGEVYGYLVRFATDTDPELLEELGADSDDLTREVSVWAFDSPDADDGIYRLDAPFPDVSISDNDEPNRPEVQRRQSYLLTNDGRVLTDENGAPLIAVTDASALGDDIAAAKHELLVRLTLVEDALQLYRDGLPPRHHNNPPGLVEDDPLSPADIATVRKAVKTLRAEAGEEDPAPEVMQAQASHLREVALSIISWIGRKFDLGIDSLIKWGVPVTAAAWAHANPDRVSRALNAAADAASKLAQLLGAN